jgi:ABC-type sugar transport system substrate-binding protein
MVEATLEERVATLEQLVAQLMRASERAGRKKEWRRTIGMFDGDPIILEIIAEGRRLREEDRRQGHT